MSAPAAFNVSRSEAAIRSWSKAVERVRRLEADADAAFAELYAARERCSAVGLVVDVELRPGMAASYADWKHREATAAAKAIAQADAEGAWHPASLRQ